MGTPSKKTCFSNAQFVPYLEHWRNFYTLKTGLYQHLLLYQHFTDHISQLYAKLIQVIKYTFEILNLDSDKSEHLNSYPLENGMNIMLFDPDIYHISFSS